MKRQLMIERDDLFARGDTEKIWIKYCGFLDLSLEEFMVIQKTLLMEQIEMASHSEVGRKIMRDCQPESVEEFRRVVPLTTYEDYEPYLRQRMDEAMPAEPLIWAHTSGRTGFTKWIPYTADKLGRLADNTLAAFILSSANRKGEVRVREGMKTVLNLPPMPYITGIMAVVVGNRLPYHAIPPLEEAEKMEFEERIRQGFIMALSTGIDFAASIAIVLAKVGESFGKLGGNARVPRSSLSPMATLRLLSAVLKSKLARRQMLPKDIWRVKGLVCGGTDIALYREQIARCWGVQPLDIYVATETGFIAMQGWDKGDMTFVPCSNFYEFITEKDWLKCQDDRTFQPSTVLLDEVKAGEIYELVVTNFQGGALLRYRIGDLIKITSLRNERTGVNLPQMLFHSRADDIIDIAGFVRLDEKTLWQALKNTKLSLQEWVARKEYIEEKPVLHIYIELSKDGIGSEEIASLVDQQLTALDKNYRDLRNMTRIHPVAVTLLEHGAFLRHMKSRQAAGFDIAHIKPPHMNASDAIINDLLGECQDKQAV